MALSTELSELPQVSQKNLKALDDVDCVKQDVAESKTLIHSNLAVSTICQYNSTYASVVQNEQSMNSEHLSTVNANSFEPANQTEPRNASATVSVQPDHVQSISQGGDPKIIAGTRESEHGSGLSGVQRTFDVFVGGSDLETSEDDNKTFCSSNEVTEKKCESIPTKSEWYKSFKVSVLLGNMDKLLNTNIWPRCVFVRKFFRARQGI